MNNPTHKHTYLQAAQSQRTDQILQKSVLFANGSTDRQPKRARKEAADNKILTKVLL